MAVLNFMELRKKKVHDTRTVSHRSMTSSRPMCKKLYFFLRRCILNAMYLRLNLSRIYIHMMTATAWRAKGEPLSVTHRLVTYEGTVKLFLTPPWRHIGGVEAYLHSFVTSAPDWGQWPNPRSGGFAPGKDSSPQYLLNRRPCGHQSRSGRFRRSVNFLPLPGFPTRTVQSVASEASTVNAEICALLGLRGVVR
jgi:hypothetical protein